MNTPVFTSSLLSDCRAACERPQLFHKTAALTEQIATHFATFYDLTTKPAI